ncbi:nitrogen fixation protein FixH [Brucella sp. BO3]|uniref:FixH family protein n=1 Tax=unclassified Brucella TaxID=2632610 RepID=UPI00084F8943|nr:MULTISPECIES: FixH family protein [unclassified Brucella]APX69510.1 nitrogen fixation protein FixH [Brucella sp. 09RB8471]MRN78475.1 nitrogen fixation protein FixH [Brucella sp. 10RB9210]OEI82334.1 nitrogen fixation protein FixH [Brucella sp. B13-0095]QMV25730.1 nitrogen fixation protein FixH [Brucella sp. BO3]
MSTNSKTSGTFTGWHMLGIMFMFFGVIIAVNLLMAYNAVHSWSGLVVQNSYVASQEFNDKAKTGKEQAALNWQSKPAYENGVFTWQLADHDGKAVAMTGGTVDFKRPVGDAHDTKVTLTVREPGILTAPLELGEGAWIMEVNADAGLEDPYRHIIRVLVKDGKIL